MAQVLPDLPMGGPPQSQPKLQAARSKLFKAKLDRFMTQREEEHAAGLATEVLRANNQHYLLALDQSLEAGTGWRLVDFLPDHILRPIAPYERQFFLSPELAESNGMVAPDDDLPGRRRSCVLDVRTGKARPELPMTVTGGRLARPSLHLASDDGPIGRPAATYLFEDLKIRGTRCRDDQHKIHNLTRSSCVEAGCWLVILETVVGMNLPSGPWEGDAFFSQLRAAGTQFLVSCEPSHEIFQYFYADICREQKWMGADFMSASHQGMVWERLKNCETLKKKGAKVKLGRWLSWHRAFGEKCCEWSIFTMFLLVLGIEKNMWTSLEASPVGNYMGPPQGEQIDLELVLEAPQGGQGEAAAAASIAAEAPRTMKRSNEVLKAERSSSAGSIDFALRNFANRYKYRVAQMVYQLLVPVNRDFARHLERFHEPDGELKNSLMLAKCSTGVVISETLQQLLSPSFLTQCEFAEGEAHSAGDEAAALAAATKKEDRVLASHAMDLAVKLARNQALAMLHHTESLPGVLVLLLDEQGSVRRACLQKLEAMWRL